MLVEDDPIFSMLVCRSWKTLRPDIPIVVAGCLAAMRELLSGASRPPELVIMDRSLPDGNGHEVALQLGVPSYCWSALGEGGTQPKPQGKPALEEAVRTLAVLAGI